MPDAKRRLPPSVISSRTTAHCSHLTNDLVLSPSVLSPKIPPTDLCPSPKPLALESPTSDPPTTVFRYPPSVFRHLASAYRPPTSEYRPLTSPNLYLNPTTTGESLPLPRPEPPDPVARESPRTRHVTHTQFPAHPPVPVPPPRNVPTRPRHKGRGSRG